MTIKRLNDVATVTVRDRTTGKGIIGGYEGHVDPLPQSISSGITLYYPEWQTQYEAALLEKNRHKLPKRVAVAELVLLNRLHVLVDKAGHEQERVAMSDALHTLRFLKGSTAQ
jgi:hypothetical protein